MAAPATKKDYGYRPRGERLYRPEAIRILLGSLRVDHRSVWTTPHGH